MVFIVIAFTRRTLNCISENRRENHAPAPPVSWPPLTEDPILVAPPESQGSFWLWFLQADYYRESIFIHYIYVTFYACSFSYNNIYIYIYIYHVYFQSEYLNVQVFAWLSSFIFLHIVFTWKSNRYCLTLNCYCPYIEPLLSRQWTVTVQTLNCYYLNTHQSFNYI
jgi:hypothetical protein